ncbi:MAG: hypothetical protein M0Z53_01440 [Thermaerobacter sp.]|nr:hypothetical protein [Thermaerobacter sp.]
MPKVHVLVLVIEDAPGALQRVAVGLGNVSVVHLQAHRAGTTLQVAVAVDVDDDAVEALENRLRRHHGLINITRGPVAQDGPFTDQGAASRSDVGARRLFDTTRPSRRRQRLPAPNRE